MSALSFQFRLHSRHSGPEAGPEAGPESESTQLSPSGATSESIRVEVLSAEDTWQPLDPSLSTPGFRLFLLSLLLCQHHYLVANAKELAIPLANLEAQFQVTTTGDWIIAMVQGHFQLQLAPQDRGQAAGVDQAQLAYLEQRMALCPVSRNLPATVQKHITVSLDQPQPIGVAKANNHPQS